MPLTLTAADTIVDSGEQNTIIANVAIVAGQPIANVATKGELAANTSAALADCIGIATNDAAIDQRVNYLPAGQLQLTAGQLALGKAYYVGAAGGIIETSELITNDFVTFLGICKATDVLTVNRDVSGVQHV